MRSTLFVTATFVVTTLLSSPALEASTITFAAVDALSPGSQVTYTEQVGLANAISPTPWRSQTSSACTTLSTTGCGFGSFTAALPSISVPAGDHVTSATLNLYYTSQISDGGITVASVSPILAQQFLSAADAGTHSDSFGIFFGTAAGNFTGTSSTGNFNELGIDYTSAVEASLASGVALSAITIGDTFTYGVSDFYSVHGGTNSLTTFNENFNLTGANLSAVLTVAYSPAPEPAGIGLFAAGFAVLVTSLYTRRQRL